MWAAAQAIADGATLDQAAELVERLPSTIGSAFLLDAFSAAPTLNVVSLLGEAEVVATVPTLLDAVNAIASLAIDWAPHVRVAVGHTGAATEPLADALQEAIGEAAGVVEVLRYRAGASSASPFSGPGVFGCFMFPA